MKKYLITGASGFVAYHFLVFLDSLNEECDVLGIDINIPDDFEDYSFPSLKLHFAKINLLDYSALETELVSFSPTHILHLAAFSSVAKSWDTPIDSFINNTNIFLNIAEIIRKNKIKCRLLSVGSSEEYGNVPEDVIPIKETIPLNPVSPYAVARVSQELLSQCYVASFGLDIILTRSFNHIGPRQKEVFVIPSFIRQILEKINTGQSGNIKLSTGDVSIIRDFLDVRDVVQAYHTLLEKGISGELYNVCSGKGKSIREIIGILSELLNVTIEIEIDKNKIRPGDNKIIIGDNSKIKKLTGWEPKININSSLYDIISYWKNILKIT